MRSVRFVLGLLCALTVLGAGSPAAQAQESTSTTLTPLRQAVTPGTATLTARVTSGGAALAGVPVQIWMRRPNHSWWLQRTLTADSAGYARYRFDGTGKYDVLARFPGAETRARSDSAVGSITEKPFGLRVIEEASRHRGKPYQWGAVGPHRFDCSGFTMYVFSRFGKRLPHNSGQQYSAVRRISKGAQQVGDLIFTYHGGRIGHVGIWAGYVNGVGYIWDSPRSGYSVSKRRLWTSTYSVGRVA